MEFLKDKIDELQIQTGYFKDLCEYIRRTNNYLYGTSGYQNTLNSVFAIITQEAERIEKASDDIFGDKRMMKFYYSLDGDNE